MPEVDLTAPDSLCCSEFDSRICSEIRSSIDVTASLQSVSYQTHTLNILVNNALGVLTSQSGHWSYIQKGLQHSESGRRSCINGGSISHYSRDSWHTGESIRKLVKHFYKFVDVYELHIGTKSTEEIL